MTRRTALAATLPAVLVLAACAAPAEERVAVSDALWYVVGEECSTQAGTSFSGTAFEIRGDRLLVSDEQPVYFAESGEPIEGQPSAFDPGQREALQACLDGYLLDDRARRLASRVDRAELWDYYRAVAIPCLFREYGLTVASFPSRQEFSSVSIPVTPLDVVGLGTVAEPLEVDRRCPMLPPSLAAAPLRDREE